MLQKVTNFQNKTIKSGPYIHLMRCCEKSIRDLPILKALLNAEFSESGVLGRSISSSLGYQLAMINRRGSGNRGLGQLVGHPHHAEHEPGRLRTGPRRTVRRGRSQGTKTIKLFIAVKIGKYVVGDSEWEPWSSGYGSRLMY